jgi:hypothetical protein
VSAPNGETRHVWIASSGDYEQWTNYLVGDSLEAAVAAIKANYTTPPYIVTWDDVDIHSDEEAYLTGHFEGVVGWSIKHDAVYDFRRFEVLNGGSGTASVNTEHGTDPS